MLENLERWLAIIETCSDKRTGDIVSEMRIAIEELKSREKKPAAYPNWICHECGMKHGNGRRGGISCWHEGQCDICKRETVVTEPRDYGHMRAMQNDTK